MGADFIEKATGTFKKSWDRARVALATADLFACKPGEAKCSAVADITENVQLQVGEPLTIELLGQELVAFRGNMKVATFSRPSAEIVRAVEHSCGVAKGEVESVHDI